MVSRTAAISLGARLGTSRQVQRSAVISLGSLVTAAPYVSGGGVVSSRTGPRSYLPHRSVKLVADDGTMSTWWYSFQDYLVNEQLSQRDQTASLSDIVTQLDTVVSRLNDAVASLALTDAQSRANATALQTVVEVSKNASLPGATQIPPVVVYKNALIESPGGGGD